MISNETAKGNQQEDSGPDSKCTVTHVKSKDSHVQHAIISRHKKTCTCRSNG